MIGERRVVRIGYVLLAVTTLCSTGAAQTLYWTERGSGTVRRMTPGGGEIETLVDRIVDRPTDVLQDSANGVIYWLDPSVGRLARSGLDGTGVETVSLFGSGVQLGGLALDSVRGQLYLGVSTRDGATDNGTIKRVDVNSGDVSDIVELPGTVARQIAVDSSGGKLYWTQPGQVRRANLDGSVIEQLAGAVGPGPAGIALDLNGGKIYFGDGAPFVAGGLIVRRMNLDGSSVEDVFSSFDGPWPAVMAVDGVEERVFWSNGSMVSSVRFDGTALSQLDLDSHVVSGFSLESTTGTIVWSDTIDGRIRRADVAGGNTQVLVERVMEDPAGITLDLDAGLLYWTAPSHSSGTNRIMRSALDGSQREVLLTSESNPPGTLVMPLGLAVAVDTGAIFFTEQFNAIRRLDVASGLVDTLVDQSIGNPSSVVVDPIEEHFFWIGGGRLMRSNLDGTGILELGEAESPLALDVTGRKLYFTRSEALSATILRANLDGSQVEELGAPVGQVVSIAVDESGGKLFWTDPTSNVVRRANLDGTNVEIIASFSASHLRGIAFHPVERRVYWTDSLGPKIVRANPDGSEQQTLVSGGQVTEAGFMQVGLAVDAEAGQLYFSASASGKIRRLDLASLKLATVSEAGNPRGVALDPTGGHVVWADMSGNGSIRRVRFDGSGGETLVQNFVDNPRHIALDLARGKMYWADRMGGSGNLIRRANLDGSGAEDLIAGLGISAPEGVALDLVADKLYWTATGSGVMRANLDGTSVETVVVSEASALGGIELDVERHQLYWVDSGAGAIMRASLDGTDVLAVASGLDMPVGLAINSHGVAVEEGVAIPTVSEWGMVAMILMMLTAGTLVVRSRPLCCR